MNESKRIDEKLVDQVIMSYCGAQGGSRVRAVKPDGYSLPMGGGDGYGFDEWATARVEEGVDAYAQSPSIRKAALDLLIKTYWDSVPILSHGSLYGPICARTISAVRAHIWKACERNPIPKSLVA